MSMITKHNYKRFAAIFACVLSIGVISNTGANATTAIGNASAQIQELIQITEGQSINFGVLLPNGGAAGTASVSTTGSITTINSASQSGSAIQSGSFSASGTPNASLNISFQDGILTGSGGSMAINALNHDAGSTPSFNGSGALTFAVGGTLQINADQPAGSYSGTYQITLDYQ